MRALVLPSHGGPEVLEVRDVPDPQPAAGEVLIKVLRAGLNFADLARTTGDYDHEIPPPRILGTEAVGIDQATGARVAALVPRGGCHAQYVLAARELTYPIPERVTDDQALALLLQGQTAWHLLRTSARLKPGESVVIQAAAGGVGSIAVQLARSWGAGRIIGMASSEEKRQLVLTLGADVAIDAAPEGLTERILAANRGKPVDIVLEMSGGAVFDACLEAVAPFGRMVCHGQASDQPNRIVSDELMATSRGILGFWLGHCYRKPELLRPSVADLYARAHAKQVKGIIHAVLPLEQARAGLYALAGRSSKGKVLLDPWAS